MRSSVVLAVVLASNVASVDRDPALARIEQALPAGWSMLATDSELVLRHDRPCYATGAAADSSGPLITLELRYRLEPKWSGKQLADARVANDKLAAELHAAHAKVAAINAKHPSGADQARLDAYAKAEASVHARMVPVPTCTLGASSLFETDDTYRQLSLSIDPPGAVTEARSVAALVKKACS